MDGETTTNAAPGDEPQAETLPTEESLDEQPSAPSVDPIPDTRLYVPDHEDWDVHLKRDSERYFCYSKHPGEE